MLGGEHFDAVVHAVAVGDFSVEAVIVDGQSRRPGHAKLASDAAPTLLLRCNPKLLDTLRTRSRNPALHVVAFKLTHGATVAEAQAAVEALFARRSADWVVHNDLASREAEGGAFPADIWQAGGAEVTHCADRAALALALEKLLLTASLARAN